MDKSNSELTWLPLLRRAAGQALIGLGRRLTGEVATAPGPLPHTSADINVGSASRASTEETGSDRFASLSSMIPGVVYQRIVRPDGDIRYTYISEGAQEMFGVSAEEILNDPEALFRTYSEDYRAQFRQRLVAASKAMTKWDVEASIVTRDGRIKYTHAIASPEALPDGSVLWTGLILDATRNKLVEEELKAANRSVEAANHAKSLFLANMSHEIRTPMNGILGMANLLLKTELSDRQNRLLTMLRHSATTLLAIINDVLDISRIESGHFALEQDPFNLLECLEEVVELCATTAYQKGLELNLVADSTLPKMVVGDSGRLRQILINLVGNAVKFTEVGAARIAVTSRPADDGRILVSVKVSDTGIGIAPEAQMKLFSPFSQADTSISRRFGGTGLGLAISRHVIQLMGGTIELESKLGVGTCVSFEIPLALADPAEQDQEASALSFDGVRALVVDDRAGTREAMRAQLKGTGAEVSEACSDNEALEILRAASLSAQPYSVVIIDRMGPGVDSLSLCQTIRRYPQIANTAIVAIMSMSWRSDQGSWPLDARWFSQLAKPVRREELRKAIARTLVKDEPCVSSSPDAAEASESEADDCPQFGLRVLLAEDNPVNQEVAREFLSMLGCDLIMVENGLQAIEKLACGDFDIVLMDCQMPLLDGMSATRQIREDEQRAGKAAIPIIAVTANAFESDRIAALDAGMNDVLTKPFTEAQLSETLTKWHPRPDFSTAA